jgi:hypothetical protein
MGIFSCPFASDTIGQSIDVRHQGSVLFVHPSAYKKWLSKLHLAWQCATIPAHAFLYLSSASLCITAS